MSLDNVLTFHKGKQCLLYCKNYLVFVIKLMQFRNLFSFAFISLSLSLFLSLPLRVPLSSVETFQLKYLQANVLKHFYILLYILETSPRVGSQVVCRVGVASSARRNEDLKPHKSRSLLTVVCRLLPAVAVSSCPFLPSHSCLLTLSSSLSSQLARSSA